MAKSRLCVYEGENLYKIPCICTIMDFCIFKISVTLRCKLKIRTLNNGERNKSYIQVNKND